MGGARVQPTRVYFSIIIQRVLGQGRRVGAGGRHVGAPAGEKLKLLLFCVARVTASILVFLKINHRVPWKVPKNLHSSLCTTN